MLATDPFAPLAHERNISIKGEYNFTRRWFRSRNQSTWSTFFPPRFKGTKPWTMLQIGVFEGADLVWCLQNILKHPKSRVLAIDPWEATTKLDAAYMEGCFQRAMGNLSEWQDKVTVFRTRSQQVLSGLEHDFFDLAVIDGDHEEEAVLEDARLTLPLVKVGGWLVFDDVRNRIPKKHHVAQGIERWLETDGGRVKLIWQHRFVDCFQRIR